MAFQNYFSTAAQDIFQPVDGANPCPYTIPRRDDHPLPRTGIINQNAPIHTNKFYANFFLGGQTSSTWTHPYSVAWCKGNGNAGSYGLAISHFDDYQKCCGDPNPNIPEHPHKYFFSPVGVQSMILSASELGNSTALTTDTLGPFSINVNLRPSDNASNRQTLRFPLVQGMGFVTARYWSLRPDLQSSVFFRNFEPVSSPKPGMAKYRVTLEDDTQWLVYAMSDTGQNPNLQRMSNTLYRGSPGFSGIFQMAKNPSGATGEAMYDECAGTYPMEGSVTGSVDGSNGQYTLSWRKGGHPTFPLLMFALPHHVQSFDHATRSRIRGVQLATTTKGRGTAVTADSWTMVEQNLPVNMDFRPWRPDGRNAPALSESQKAFIRPIATREANQDFNQDINDNTDSMYFSGKRASKYATLVYTMHLVQHPNTGIALEKLKNAVATVIGNAQKFPLVYETAWKGVVSSGAYVTGDPIQDFGNTYYNDHQFHYAYWIHAAAIIAHLDPSWTSNENTVNKEWVNMLVKDACNPMTNDAFYPFSRHFDWYHGHSWAHGLFEFADGKDLESTSEEGLFAYAVKMWGSVIGDRSMEARGNLMLSILARTFRNYFLLESDNENHPASFIGNKVAGILFENKCDHATFFSPDLHCIQGIHMIPLNPSSAFLRSSRFVREEWDVYFSTTRTGAAEPAPTISSGGWRSIVYANLALIDARASWDYFARPDFDEATCLDDGACRSWYLIFAAGLGN